MTGVGPAWYVSLSRFLFLVHSLEGGSLLYFIPFLGAVVHLPGISYKGSKDGVLVDTSWLVAGVIMLKLVGLDELPCNSVGSGSSWEALPLVVSSPYNSVIGSMVTPSPRFTTSRLSSKE